MGHDSGACVTTGCDNIMLGYKTNTNGTATENIILIGHGDGINKFVSGGNNTIKMGKRTANINNDFSSNANWSHSSDARYKKNVKDNTIGLDFINDLRTVTYQWKALSELDPSLAEYDKDKTQADCSKTQHGLLAQEVKTSMDKLGVTEDFAGWSKDIYHKNEKQNISESMYVIPLIKAVQELKAEIDELKKGA